MSRKTKPKTVDDPSRRHYDQGLQLDLFATNTAELVGRKDAGTVAPEPDDSGGSEKSSSQHKEPEPHAKDGRWGEMETPASLGVGKAESKGSSEEAQKLEAFPKSAAEATEEVHGVEVEPSSAQATQTVRRRGKTDPPMLLDSDWSIGPNLGPAMLVWVRLFDRLFQNEQNPSMESTDEEGSSLPTGEHEGSEGRWE